MCFPCISLLIFVGVPQKVSMTRGCTGELSSVADRWWTLPVVSRDEWQNLHLSGVFKAFEKNQNEWPTEIWVKMKNNEKYFKPPQKSSTSHRETDESCTCLSSLSLFCYLKPSGATIIGITPGNDFTILAHSSKSSIGSCYLFDVMKLILISFFRRSPHMTRPYCSCFRNLTITTERMKKKRQWISCDKLRTSTAARMFYQQHVCHRLTFCGFAWHP